MTNRQLKLVILGILATGAVAAPLLYTSGWGRPKFKPHLVCESYGPGRLEGACKPGDVGYPGEKAFQ
jgi:hypothetical protein